MERVDLKRVETKAAPVFLRGMLSCSIVQLLRCSVAHIQKSDLKSATISVDTINTGGIEFALICDDMHFMQRDRLQCLKGDR